MPRPVVRRIEGGFVHWCPACETMHVIPTGEPYSIHWTFTGPLEKPSFAPSVRITYNGADAGQLQTNGRRAPAACCHYIITYGQIQFCPDSSHAMAGRTVSLPPPPE